VRVLEPGDARVAFGLSIAQGVAARVPGGTSVLGDLQKLVEQATESVSLTIPAPGGTLILLSKAAVVNGRSYFRTGMHELVHDRQIAKVGGFQSVVDYLGSGELRADREAEASAIGMWADFVTTGERPSPDDASVLRSTLYHLDPPDKAFARAVVLSTLGSIDEGGVPPFSVAQAMLLWLRANAPETIAVSDYR
jgi:hypothetical protein